MEVVPGPGRARDREERREVEGILVGGDGMVVKEGRRGERKGLVD